MNNAKTISSRSFILMIVGALVLIGLGTVGIAQATNAQLAIFSQNDVAGISQTHLGVNLTENGKEVAVVDGEGVLLADDGKTMLDGDAQMIPGKEYAEAISVVNETDMPEYVRLTVRKYWENEDGTKTPSINPALIELISTSDDWVLSTPENTNESTDERLVFYYRPVLGAHEKASSPAVSAIALSPDVLSALSDGTSARIVLTAQVDSIQTSHAADAAKSAWGIDISKLGLDWGNE